MRDLNLHRLGTGMPAITPSFGMALAEAGGVCLESQGHENGTCLIVNGDQRNWYRLSWPSITESVRRCWNDLHEATEFGAVGVAVLLAKEEIGYSAIERSRKGTGFDYWIGCESEIPFQKMAKLEVSGILVGDLSRIRERVRQKMIQIRRTKMSTIGYVIVVEFGRPVAEMRISRGE